MSAHIDVGMSVKSSGAAALSWKRSAILRRGGNPPDTVRFVPQPEVSGRTVVLEPDIAKVFKSSKSVNSVLRALIGAMPH